MNTICQRKLNWIQYIRPKKQTKMASSSSSNAAYVIAAAAAAMEKCVCANETAEWVGRSELQWTHASVIGSERRALFTVCTAHGFNGLIVRAALQISCFSRCAKIIEYHFVRLE